MKCWVSLLVILAVLSPGLASAAPEQLAGYETGDESEASADGGGNTTIVTSPKRTGNFALQISPASGDGTSYHDYTISPIDSDAYARASFDFTSDPTAARVAAGFFGTHYGCKVDREADGSFTLWYKDRTYAYGQTPAYAAGSFWGLEVHQQNNSGGSCSGSGVVACELYINGINVLKNSSSSIACADYEGVTKFRVGASDTVATTYTMVVDDLKVDDSVPIGPGRLVALTPDANGSLVAWGNGGNVGNCGSGASKFGCVDDFASGAHDSASSYLDTSSSGDKMDLNLNLPTGATLASGESVQAALALSYGAEQTAGTRTYRVNLTNAGASAVAGATICDTPDDGSYLFCKDAIRTSMPGGGAWNLGNLAAQLEKVSSGTNRVTAVLVYADIREPEPPVRQNLQDWNKMCRGGTNAGAACTASSECPSGTCTNICVGGSNAGAACSTTSACPSGYCGGDGRTTHCFFCDSRMQGTQGGTCSNNASTSCTTNFDCSGGGVCNSSGKIPTIAGGRLIQKIGTKSTAIINYGVNGNTPADALTRIPGALSGVGAKTTRYCQSAMPTTCAVDSNCVGGSNDGARCTTGTQCPSGACSACGTFLCGSDDCVNESVNTADCSLSGALVVGSYVCQGGTNQGADCSVDSECPSGACTALPGCDYVYDMCDVNALHTGGGASTAEDCNFANGMGRPPCPPMASSVATPNATPSPQPTGGYFMPRVTCVSDLDCQTGRCSNNMAKACDVDGDCTPGTCQTSKKINGTTYCQATCSNDASRFCSSVYDCKGAASTTCTGQKYCGGSCAAVPCTTNDRPDGTSSECGPGTLTDAAGHTATAITMYGRCSGGWCSKCGAPGTADSAQNAYLRKFWNATVVIRDLRTLGEVVAAAGRRLISLTPTRINETEILGFVGWADTLRDMKIVRDWRLQQGTYVVDLWGLTLAGNQMALQPRCNNSCSTVCHSNADCPGAGAVCLNFLSVLRPQFTAGYGDEVHLGPCGAAIALDGIADYAEALSPVCSGDATTGCGRCHLSGVACTASDTCAGYATSNEKCVWDDAVCVGAGKGHCTEERVGNRCTLDLGTACSSNGDCTNKGICRPEGLPAVGGG